MAGMIGSPPYGMKAIRQIRASNTTSTIPAPTSRLQKKKESTYRYFLEKIDPILGECITHLLLLQPQDIATSMIEYLQCVQQNKEIELPIGKHNQPKKELKLFLATSIGPVVAKLVNRLAVLQPENVLEFMVKELESMKVEDALIPDTIKEPAPVPIIEEKAQQKSQPKSIQIAVLGNGDSGKTSIVNILQGKFHEKIRPTLGFRPSSMMFGEDMTIRFYDLGGGKKIRDIWDQYYHDIHGIIYVIDSSLTDEKFQETSTLFESTLTNRFLLGKPLLVFANKQDLPNAKSAKELQETLPLHPDYADNLFIAECNAALPEDVPETFRGDPNIEAAIEMLCKRIIENYGDLQARVVEDSAAKAIEEARRRIERERKVLRNKIASAFIAQLTKEQVETLQVEADEANRFDEEEGVKFLAAEIGEDPAAMSSIGIKIAAMVGYQRLALQIVGALKSPISKKKVPMSWEEIFQVISELREELKLPHL